MKSKFYVLNILWLISVFLFIAGGCHKTEVIQKNESKNHILTFAGEGVAIKPQSVAHGTHAVKPDNPERDCYYFRGWFTDDEAFTNKWNFETDIVTQDTTLYAKWVPIPLRGTEWKLEGIVDVQTGELKVLEPKDDELCYTINFETDSTFRGYSSTNRLHVLFVANYEDNSFQIIDFFTTYICEIKDGSLYTKPFKNGAIHEAGGFPPRFGYRHDVNYNMENSGEWTDLPNGDKIWRLAISCPGALSINLLYDRFWLPDDAKFFFTAYYLFCNLISTIP